MPWAVKKTGNKWAIYKPGTGEIVGHSTSKAKAQASVRARYAGANRSGEKLSDPIDMASLERAAVLCTDLNELADSGWDVQTLIFNKDKYSNREDAIAKAKEMDFKVYTSRETGDEDSGSWRVRQRDRADFTDEFKSQKVNDYITLVYGKLK
jgi:hypothetical protein